MHCAASGGVLVFSRHYGGIAIGCMQALPPEALNLATALHQQLSIDERDWHRLKGDRSRRAAEQIAAALVQILQANPGGEQEALALIDSAGRWLTGEQRDPGCPSRHRSP
jgi:hypothetical protein